MSVTPAHCRADFGDLGRAGSAMRTLEHAGLGPMDWMGPVWIGVMGDLEPEALDFVAARLRQDTRLHRKLRTCRTPGALQRAQKEALRCCLAAYSAVTNTEGSAIRRFVEHECRGARVHH